MALMAIICNENDDDVIWAVVVPYAITNATHFTRISFPHLLILYIRHTISTNAY